MTFTVILVPLPAGSPATNVWVIGDDAGLLVIDAGTDATAVGAVVDHRRVQAIVCTHGDADHIIAAPAVSDIVTAPIYIGAGDRSAWDLVHPDHHPYDELGDGDAFRVAGEVITVLPTPGHSPGGIALYAAGPGLLFAGDTLLRAPWADPPADPAALGLSVSVLAGLPATTVVHHAHGPDSTVAEHRG